MATLEKIRSKSVFLIIVIGVALLAFIVGDALTNSRNIFGDQTTVAKVGSTKIDYTEYQQKREELNQQLEEMRRQNPAQADQFDTQLLPQLALDQLIQEKLIDEAAQKAGIQCTGNLLRYYMIDNPNQQIMQELQPVFQSLMQSGFNFQTPQQAYDLIFNPKKNGLTDAQVEPYQRTWLSIENKAKKLIVRQIYSRLLASTVRPNKLDLQALYGDYVDTKEVAVAFRPFGQLDPKKYPVSDQELQAAYDKEKGTFKVSEPTKDISFIAVTVMPSEADQNAARQLAAKTVAALNSTAGTLSKDLKKEGVSIDNHNLRASDVSDPSLKAFLESTPLDSAAVLKQGIQGFTAYRLKSRSQEVDSIQLNVVQTATPDLGKKVMTALNGGLSVDSISVRFSVDSVATQLNQWIPLYTADGPTNALPKEQLDSLVKAGGRFITLQSGAQGALIAQVVKQTAPVTVYSFDEANYVLGPSSKTLGDARAKLEKYLAANNTAAKFASAASKSGYNLQSYSVDASTPAIPMFPGGNQYYAETRQVMRWVIIDGEEGEVSHIYEAKNPTAPVLYAACINRAYDEYRPLANPDVKEYITEKVRAQKAGDALVKTYKPHTGSMAAAAKAMGVNAQTLPSFRFGRNPGVNDPEVTGMICGAKAGKPVITKGLDGVYVYQVIRSAKAEIPFNEQMMQQQYMQLINPDLKGLLMGAQKFKNNIYKFEAGE